MARPKVPLSEKRNVKFTLQLTQSEKQQLQELSEKCGKAPATLARDKIFFGRFPIAKAARIDLLTYTELRKIGVNLNQLTRLANTRLISPELLTVLLRLDHQMDGIIAKLVYDR